ncbi:hypothetical protein JXA70_03245 [candidate division KSB1 bacterium]|nr:hypothetical protein [candidate division KSB1 bacterium]
MQHRTALEELLKYIRILILDKDEQFASSLKSELNQAGYPFVDQTSSTEQAWDKLPTTNIVLVDFLWGDGEENSLQFVQRAKAAFQEEIDAFVYSTPADKLSSYVAQTGATAWLEKPLNFNNLTSWIRETARRIWYEKILNNIPDEVIVIEPSDKEFGKLHFVNKTKKDRFEKGLPLEYDYCWKRFERQGNGSHPCFECLAREAKSERRIVRNYWNYKNWDGKNESVDIHAAPIFDQMGNIRGIIETCRDRTLQEVIERNLRRIETENDWAERLNLFLQGFTELGYSRVRFYQKQQKNGHYIYKGICQIGMPEDFDIRHYSYDASTDIPTQIVTNTRRPALFLVKYEGDFAWTPVSTTRNVYRVNHELVPNNHILAKHRWVDIPIKADREIIAKVSAEPDDPKVFISNHDLTLLANYADWAGQALWSAEQGEKLRLKDATNQLIIQMNYKISKVPIHNRWVYMAVKRVCQVLKTSGCSLFLLQGKGRNERLVRMATFVQDIYGQRVRKMDITEEYAVGQFLVGSVFQNGRNRYFNNLTELAESQDDPNMQRLNLPAYNYYCEKIGEDVRNAMFVVLRAGNRKVGVVRTINKQRADVFGNRDFTTDDMRVLQALAGQISVGFETDGLIKELRASQEYKEFIAQEYSHTLKNLMQPVISISGLLKMEAGDKSLLNLLDNEIIKMKTTINTMLQLVKAESTNLLLHKSYVKIKNMLEEVIKPYIILASDKKMDIRLSLEEDMQDIYLDERLIYDAIANLLDNAIKYGYKNTYIKVRAWVKYDKLFISVADVGETIAKEDRVRIFDKFFLGKHTVDKIRQLGLGLTYVKVVTEAHGGKVYVDPRFQRGAKIIMSIPLTSKEEEENREKDIDR